ncbi:hypothetical protein BPODLACK_00497 [Gordonia sp. YY1]|nr:hypothetical protein BPODLACK_00497 [Gordonia sp. YY1]
MVLATGHGSRISRSGAKRKPAGTNQNDSALSHFITAVSHVGVDATGRGGAGRRLTRIVVAIGGVAIGGVAIGGVAIGGVAIGRVVIGHLL